MNGELLSISLQIAVPLWIAKITDEDWSWTYMLAEAARCSQVIAEHGDDILFKSKKPGKTAEAFNALALGIAIAAHSPGGIKVFGSRFKVEESMQVITNTQNIEGSAEILGADRMVKWRAVSNLYGSLEISGVTWSDAEKILIALKMANRFNILDRPVKAAEVFTEDRPLPAASKVPPKTVSKSTVKLDTPTRQPNVVENIDNFTVEELEEIPTLEPPPMPGPPPGVVDAERVLNNLPPKNGNPPDEVVNATQFRQILVYWKAQDWDEARMIAEAERLASLVDENGDPMFPIIARIPDIAGRVKRNLQTLE